MISKFHITHALACTVSLLAFASGTAHAAEADADAAAAGSSGIADIVVTAERREISLQEAPLSVSAVTSETLKAANITDITGLNGSVPGLVVARSGGGERIISIRGIGSETPENTNTQPGVSYHIDGVYIFNSIAASAAFIDVAQVEVLRGPQGTLFGQGSTGGTINVVTNEPTTDAMTGNVNVGIGNYKYMEGSGALNVPVTDTLAVRGAIQYTKHDGYAHATKVPGYEKYQLDDQDETGWRLGAKWSPTSNFSITLNTIQYDSKTNGPAQKNILDPEPDARLLTQDYPGRSAVKTQFYSGTMRYETPFAVIKSITGYQKLHSEQAWDADGLDTDLFYALTYSPLTWGGSTYDHVPLWQSDTESWSQEINLTSNHGGPFSWVAGGVYLHSKNSQYINEYKGSDDQILRSPLPLDTAWNDPEVGVITYAELSSIKRELYAFYAQGTYELTSDLKLTAGARYNHDKSSGMFDSVAGGASSQTSGSYLQPSSTGTLKGDAWTGKVALDYQFTPDNMVYASWTRGFKPGGINSAASSGSSFSILPAYKQETVDSFEIGTKNRFLDDTLQINASGFLYNYKNMQFLEEDPILYGEGISNAPKARVYGIELETTWAPTNHLRFDTSVSWLEGEFTSHYEALDPAAAAAAQNAAGYPDWLFWLPDNFFPAVMARDAARADIKGNRVPKLPRWQGTAAATWNGQVGPGELTARAQLIYRGKYQYRLFNDGAVDMTPSYTQVNLMAKYEPNGTNTNVTLRVINLFDKNGINSRFSDPYGSAQVMDTYIPPRQVILSVGYQF
ncbi:TonB-dependent receptor [Novosphingobium mangrovi (ex Huang et al. 2023)]|uniref:TonB-dependent receptor n=1 Tax=Novosphingobium mangrovi (ex Huang et al. 2023) TaxID=2976432 RepID=A0ABT2I6J9_9SPHN|nr:TonB-dependent receptor [Novosphingobium mangrovi (ex Huang et al. 2023)]MCT2400439.1 TonB-dependent receptor [Novosphingobium mangrovi (ex Huang et al. 2023)]